MPNYAAAAVQFGKDLWREVRKDQVSNGAAALAFFTMLALFPAAIFGLSLLPYLPIPHLQQAIFELLDQLMPAAAAHLFTGTVKAIMSQRSGGLLSFGLMFTLWSGSSGLYAVMQQLNVVYGVEETRSLVKGRAIALLLMFICFVLMIVTFGLVIFGGVLQDWVATQLGWSAGLRLFFAILRWVMITFALLSTFALVYRLAPNADYPFRLLRAGNVVATIGLLLTSFGFRVYVGNFGSYNKTYGSLGAVIVLLMWLFISGWVVLLGGEINDLVNQRRRSGDQRVRSQDERGAADPQRSAQPDAAPGPTGGERSTAVPSLTRSQLSDGGAAQRSRSKR